MTLSIKTEVNVPGGEPRGIAFHETDFIRSIFRYLCNDEKKEELGNKSIKEIVQLHNNEQKLLTKEDYEQKVLPHLIEQVLNNQSEFAPFKEHKESFSRYVTDQAAENPTEKDKEFSKILENYFNTGGEEGKRLADLTGLCKALFTKILPSVLANTCNREFGRSPPYMEEKIKGSIAGKAVPYLAAGTPSNGTEFGDYARALCYQYMTAIVQGITPEQFEYLYDKLYESALAQVHNQIPLEKTLENEEFKRLTGFSLKDFVFERDRKKALEFLNGTDSNRLLAEMELSRFHITEYPLLFRSNPVNLTEMMAGKIACSGTAGKRSFYSGFNNAALDESIGKKIKDTYETRESQNRTATLEISDKKVEQFLEQTLKVHSREEKMRSIVDSGGFFEKHTNIEVARAILAYCSSSNKLKNIKGIVFFYRDPATNNETFAYLTDPNGEPIPLKDTTPETLLSAGIDLNNFFVFFDQLRSTGTDIPLPPDAVSLITVDLKKSSYSSFMQASLRPRRFLESQDNELVIYNKEKPTNDPLDVMAIIKILEQNEKRQVQELVYSVYRAKIANAFRTVFLEKILNTKDFKKQLELYCIFNCYLVEQRGSSFFKKMHHQEEELDTHVALKLYGQKLRDQLTDIQEEAYKTEVNTALRTISKVLNEARQDIENEVLPKKVKSSSQESSQLEKDCEVEVETEKELEIQFEKEQENLVEKSVFVCDMSKKPFKEIDWTIEKLSILEDFTPFDYCSFNGSPQGFSGPIEGKFAKLFPGNLHMTHNFRRTFENEELHLLTDKHQKSAEHILVLKDRLGEWQFMLL